MTRRVRLYARKGIWWAAWTADKVTVRRSTRSTSEAEARAVVESWPGLPERRAVLRETIGRVYFVEAIGLDLVKIGYTRVNGMKRRLEHLRCYCPVPVVVIGGYPGPMADEREEHRRWAKDRVRGEWFRKTTELTSYLDEVSEWARVRASSGRHSERIVKTGSREPGANQPESEMAARRGRGRT